MNKETYLVAHGYYDLDTKLYLSWSDVYEDDGPYYRLDAYDQKGNHLHSYMYDLDIQDWRVF